MDALEQFKAAQRASWAHFAPLQMQTMGPAARLVRWSRLAAGQQVLDVACGTGVVALTAARQGARVTALDLTPELLDVARSNAQIAGLAVEWHEGDAGICRSMPAASTWSSVSTVTCSRRGPTWQRPKCCAC